MGGEKKEKRTIKRFIAKYQALINFLLVLLLCAGFVFVLLFYSGVFYFIPSFIKNLEHPPRYDIAFFEDTPVIVPDDIIDIAYHDDEVFMLPADYFAHFEMRDDHGKFITKDLVVSIDVNDKNLYAITADGFLLRQSYSKDGWETFDRQYNGGPFDNVLYSSNGYALLHYGILRLSNRRVTSIRDSTDAAVSMKDATGFMALLNFHYVLDKDGTVHTYRLNDGSNSSYTTVDADSPMHIPWENMIWIGAARDRTNSHYYFYYYGVDKDGMVYSGRKISYDSVVGEYGELNTETAIIGSWDMQGSYVVRAEDGANLVLTINEKTGAVNGRRILAGDANFVPSVPRFASGSAGSPVTGADAVRHIVGNRILTLTDEGGVADISSNTSVLLYSRSDLVSMFGTWGLREDGRVVNLIAVTKYGLNGSGHLIPNGYRHQFLDEHLEKHYGHEYNRFDWKEIICVAEGESHMAGLRADGTVIAVGSNEHGQCNVSGWKDVIWIWAGEDVTIGQRRDGTLLVAGDKAYAAAAEWDGTAPAVFGNAWFLP